MLRYKEFSWYLVLATGLSILSSTDDVKVGDVAYWTLNEQKETWKIDATCEVV